MEAVEDDNGGVDILVNRSKAYSALPDHKKAREDAELAVQRQPDKPSVLENVAFTLYEMDLFEKALVNYHQGLQIRKKPDYFLNGVQVATETIEDSIGRHAGDFLDKNILGDTVLQIWLNEQHLLDPWIKKTERKPWREKLQMIQAEKYFGEKYLNRLSHDKQFLLNYEDNTQLYAGSIETYIELQNVIKDALTKINRKQKTLMRYLPMYVHKMRQIGLKTSSKMKRKLDLKRRKEEYMATRLLIQTIYTAREAQRKHDTQLCLRKANRARELVRSQPTRLIREKSLYMRYIYEMIGDLYLGMKELIPSWSKDENDFRILYMMGIKVVDECTEEHLRGTFLPYIHDPKSLLEESEKGMALAANALERAYLYHEMSRCCNQLKKYELARTMGRRCAQEARPAKEHVWVVNGMFMVARFESLQRNYVDAKNTIAEAIETCKKILLNSKVSDFLTRTLQLLDFVGSIEVDRNTVVAKREKGMIASMPNRDMKMKMALIFMNTSRLPPSRRMMIIPGVVPTDSVKKRKKSLKEKKISQPSPRGSVRDRRQSENSGKGGRSLNKVTIAAPRKE